MDNSTFPIPIQPQSLNIGAEDERFSLSTEQKPSGEFKVVADEGSQRRDLQQRLEYKYQIDQRHVSLLRQVLDACYIRQVHDRPVSIVRSLYFDEPGLPACHANLQGLGRRQKVRLRWYEVLRPGREFFFEIKWRENKVTGKHRLRINARHPLYEYPFKKIMSELWQVLPKSLTGFVARPLEPVLVVEYQREHFVAPDVDLRLTLDYGLRFLDQTGRRSWRFDFGVSPHNLALIECKVPPRHASLANTLLEKIPLRVQSCSKYVKGCQSLGLVHG